MKVWCKQQIFPDSANEGRYTIGKADTSLIDQFLSILVHVVIILLILTTGDVVHPLLIVKVPTHGLFNTLLELQAWLPTKFLLQLSGVYGIAHVMSGTVGNVCDEVERCTLRVAQQAVNGLDDYLNDIDVLPLVETTDVISIGSITIVENHIDCTCMVNDVEPVAYVLAFAIHWQRLALTDIVDEQRYQFLGELIRTVVV